MPSDETTSSLEEILFREIARIPFVYRNSQEFHLGIQLRVPRALQCLGATHQNGGGESGQRLAIFCQQLALSLKNFDAQCKSSNLTAPSVDSICRSILFAQVDIHGLQNSHALGFCQYLKRQPGDLVWELTTITYELLELLTSLPLRLLEHMSNGSVGETGSEWDETRIQEFLEAEGHSFEDIYDDSLKKTEEAESLLLMSFLRLVPRAALKKLGNGVEFLDLIQEGFLGVMSAVDSFDYRAHDRFMTYAMTWVWQRTSRATKNMGRTVRIPVHIQDSGEISEDAVDEAWLMGPSISFEALRSNGSDEQEYNEAEKRWETFKEDAVGYQVNPVASEILCAETTDFFLACLDEKPRFVVSRRFGLESDEEETLEQVGSQLGVTRERIRQIEKKALIRLKKRGVGKCFQDFCALRSEQCTRLLDRDVVASMFCLEDDEEWSKFGRTLEERREFVALVSTLPIGRRKRINSLIARIGEAMEAIGRPAHFMKILAVMKSLGDSFDRFSGEYLYSVLRGNESEFKKHGDGFFGLHECPSIAPIDTFLVDELSADDVLSDELQEEYMGVERRPEGAPKVGVPNVQEKQLPLGFNELEDRSVSTKSTVQGDVGYVNELIVDLLNDI